MDLSVTTKAAEADFDPEQVRAELDRAAELAMASPASQAACDVMSLVRRKAPVIKTMPVTTRFRGAGVRTDEMDRWWASWGCNGQSYSLYLSMYGPFTSKKADGTTGVQIHGDGFLSLDVDGEQVMALRVELRCDDPDSRILVVGATEFEAGQWTEVVVELARRLADATAPKPRRKAA
ncbi:hypothetical protein FFK22_017015 [Mycobacterium sp. KBS0706]|uniref:hypothetical protein n=1 Tax=Mycobacterium sp. KBS0706 TaxID=2578109 RepID=UPI00110FBE47|nr:hypothetical protein [Mycobacterium sp. KBS0706]TSD87543.1 hypothetical protein FFK22_017015 [Mycobacterium sp. KBS0706]